LVACGYSQIPGVDFQESYSPVINDVAFRILIIFQIVWRLESVIIDVEAAFLNGELEEEIYMEVPDGIDHKQDEVLLLHKSLYGLVQAARQFNKKFSEILQQIGFTQNAAEPCLFYNNSEKGICMLVVHVDDCYVIGTKETLSETINNIKSKGLTIKTDFSTKDYLSCEVRFNNDKTKAWFGQPHMIKRIRQVFGSLVNNMYSYKTAGTPGFHIQRPKTDMEKISENEQKVYRSAVGSLLQLVKYSRPDIANVVRELSKCMDGATPSAFKEMKRVIKYVLDTPMVGLKLCPNLHEQEWKLEVFSDSDWAGDKDNLRSVSGFSIFLCGVPILWKSRLQKAVSLSSSEAEFYAVSEAAREIRFVYQILTDLDLKVTLPIIVKVDNVGAIFMSENSSATSRTKHIDTRYHYIREFIEEGFLKIVFVRSSENLADFLTKNVSKDVHEFHVNEYVISQDGICENQNTS
jgi:hypothetical protein